jgi:chemotaxis signal transduction protein
VRIGTIEKRHSRSVRRTEAVILFAVAGHAFAINAAAVEEIRDTADLRPLRGASGAKVSYTVQRDQHTYFVVDANQHLRLLSSHPTRVLLLRNSCLALSVDSIDRMAEITQLHSLPRAFQGEERNWYRGLALIGEQVVPVINPAAFLNSEELAILESAANSRTSGIAKGAAKGAATA